MSSLGRSKAMGRTRARTCQWPYPRSNKIYWRGLGLIARLEPLDYGDGEPED